MAPPISGLDYAHSQGARSHLITEIKSEIWMHELIMTTFYYMTTSSNVTTVFFSEIVLWGNHFIKRVALVEENSILLPPRCLEASGVEFLRLVDNQQNLLREHPQSSSDKKTSPGGLRTP